MTREQVYKRIDGEREYHDRKWPGHGHHVAAYLTYMHYYLQAMISSATLCEECELGYIQGARGGMRKFASLAVACMEENGISYRNGQVTRVFNGVRLERASVYAAIDAERECQESGSGGRFTALRRAHEFGELLTMLRHYMRLADAAWSGIPGSDAALDVVRKLAAIAVRAMELYGAPER
ncbi:MAG: hypothetical protein ABSB88_05820 [Bryobacteraceae bacterium]